MPVRVSNLSLPVEVPEAELASRLASALGILSGDLVKYRIQRKSLDLRDKRQLKFNYNLEVDLAETAIPIQASVQVEAFEELPFSLPPPGAKPMPHRPVVIGSGPGGLVCAYFLAQQGYRPIVLERGTIVSDRIRDVKKFDGGEEFDSNSNYLFGEGGAGTFSDGKLTCRGTGPDVDRVLQLFEECKGQQPGKPSIRYYHRPHLGSNRLPAVVKAIRRKIEEFGGEVRFLTKVEDLAIDNGALSGVATSGGMIPASVAVLAIGHSARDTYEMLHRRGVPMAAKPFQFGVRIEHRQDVVNAVQYGFRHDHYEELLGNADYSLVARGENDLFTFCMCAGGYIIPSVSEAGAFCTNGMSLSKRDSVFANSGLVVTVPVTAFEGTDVLAGMRLQQQYESRAYQLGSGQYAAPAQRAKDYLNERTSGSITESSYPRSVASVELRELLPPLVAKAVAHGLPQMDRRWQGRFLKDAILYGPESRGSSPIRIERNEDYESPGVAGLYPVGEGAGYAGGIVSAAVDGLRIARAIMSVYSTPSA